MAYQFVFGVDVRTIDEAPTAALSIVEKEKDEQGAAHMYRVHRLACVPAEDLEGLAESIQEEVAQRPYIGRTALIVTRNEPAGAALFEALDDRGLAPVGAELSDGTSSGAGDQSDMQVTVGTRRALQALVDLHHEGRFDPSAVQNSDAAGALMRTVRRLTDASAEVNALDGVEAAAPDEQSYPAALMSTALACWFGREQTFDPTQRLKGEMEGIHPSSDGTR